VYVPTAGLTEVTVGVMTPGVAEPDDIEGALVPMLFVAVTVKV
jgi:hypothetical protein